MMRLPPALAVLLPVLALLALPGCAQFPDLDSALSPGAERADYPDLLPVEQLQGQIPQARVTEQTAASVTARVAALKARAARLKGSVIDSPTRARLNAGVPGA